jgi:hypothetical protein
MRMPKVICEMGGVSADGRLVGPDGSPETADTDRSDVVRGFALVWQALPKVTRSRERTRRSRAMTCASASNCQRR